MFTDANRRIDPSAVPVLRSYLANPTTVVCVSVQPTSTLPNRRPSAFWRSAHPVAMVSDYAAQVAFVFD
jgi:hypothetical protein